MEKRDIRNNCFNFVRLIAALDVFLVHAFLRLQVDVPMVVSNILGCIEGVPIFFGLSGFLIWSSTKRTKTFKDFLTKRFLRIYPEMWISVLLSFLTIILLYKKIEWPKFILFQLAQATVLQFWTPSFLRGYGCGTPNGSLWTITVMIQCYIVIWFSRKLLSGAKPWKWGVSIILGIGINIVKQFSAMWLPDIVDKLFGVTFLPYIWIFLLGAFINEYFDVVNDKIIKYWWLSFLAASAVYIFKFDLGRYGTLKSVFLVLSIIGFGYRFIGIKIKFDISYGIYVYHMVVINAFIHIGFTGNMLNVVLALIISIIISIISAKTVNKLLPLPIKIEKIMSAR